MAETAPVSLDNENSVMVPPFAQRRHNVKLGHPVRDLVRRPRTWTEGLDAAADRRRPHLLPSRISS